MDNNVEAAADDASDSLPRSEPICLETRVGDSDVADWQMEPAHVPVRHGITESLHLEARHLVRLYQRDDRGRSPSFDRIEVDMKVTSPGSGHGRGLHFARAEGDPDAPQALARLHG